MEMDNTTFGLTMLICGMGGTRIVRSDDRPSESKGTPWLKSPRGFLNDRPLVCSPLRTIFFF